MPSIKFAAAKIKFLEGVRGKQVDYFDKTLSGFFVRISQDGKRVLASCTAGAHGCQLDDWDGHPALDGEKDSKSRRERSYRRL